MKTFTKVETTRVAYHKEPLKNTIHRSSLIVPEIDGTEVDISFLNHFLIKRGYENIGCRISAIDAHGALIETRLISIDEPRVYKISLSRLFDYKARNYVIEFFSAKNLFIPFPAVMMNHRGNGSISYVHSYSRLLNDVFEEDSINQLNVAEASIDIRRTPGAEPVILFSSGIKHINGTLQCTLAADGISYEENFKIDCPRLSNLEIKLSDIFKDLPATFMGHLKITPPEQFMFYGRLLVGHRTADGAFSGNHSYYDCSTVTEYWPSALPSMRLYPYFNELENIIRIYPNMSLGTYDCSVNLFDGDGKNLREISIGKLSSPSNEEIDISISELVRLNRIEVSSFELQVRPLTGNAPTRVSNQLVYASGALEASFPVGLVHSEVFVSERKKVVWGQLVIGGGFESWLGIVSETAKSSSSSLEVSYYSEEGLIAKRQWKLQLGAAIIQKFPEDLPELMANLDDLQYVWYYVQGESVPISSFSVTRNIGSGHCTGEHGF